MTKRAEYSKLTLFYLFIYYCILLGMEVKVVGLYIQQI